MAKLGRVARPRARVVTSESSGRVEAAAIRASRSASPAGARRTIRKLAPWRRTDRREPARGRGGGGRPQGARAARRAAALAARPLGDEGAGEPPAVHETEEEGEV